MSVTGEQSVSMRPYLLVVTEIASLCSGRTVRPTGTKTLVWNRERFITDSYKEMGGDSCPKNPKVTESFQEVPLKAKGGRWVWLVVANFSVSGPSFLRSGHSQVMMIL